MDRTDIVLCQLLLGNSRLSHSELADKLNLSVTAIHTRIQDLIESRVIRKFTQSGLRSLGEDPILPQEVRS